MNQRTKEILKKRGLRDGATLGIMGGAYLISRVGHVSEDFAMGITLGATFCVALGWEIGERIHRRQAKLTRQEYEREQSPRR